MITINAQINANDFRNADGEIDLDVYADFLVALDKRLTDSGVATMVSLPTRPLRQAKANDANAENGPFATYYLAWRAKQGKPIQSIFSKSGMTIEDSARFYLQKGGFIPEQLDAIASGQLTIDGINASAASIPSTQILNEEDIL